MTTVALTDRRRIDFLPDYCPRCNPLGDQADRPVRLAALTEPTSVTWPGGSRVTCAYACGRCGHQWAPVGRGERGLRPEAEERCMSTPTTDPIALLSAAAAVRRSYGRRLPDNPADLARLLIPDYHVTPTIRLLSDELVKAADEPDAQVILTCPPRTGKSVLTSQVFPVWALARNPDTEVIVKSYADDLAEEHSRWPVT